MLSEEQVIASDQLDETESVSPVESSAEVNASEAPAGKELILKKLLAAYEAWFNITKDYDYAGRHFEGYAEFHERGAQYIATKKAEIWSVNSYEYLFFKLTNHVSAADIESFVEFMTTEVIKKVQPEKDHMSSYLSLVLIADSADEDVEKVVAKTKFRKNFMLGLRGWADLRLCVIDLQAQKILSNAAGKHLKPTLEANAGFPDGKKKRRRR